jgi:hypothetical protein
MRCRAVVEVDDKTARIGEEHERFTLDADRFEEELRERR